MAIESDGPTGFYCEDKRRARKQHQCRACCETIRRGDVYVTIAVGSRDGVYSTKQCLRCNAILRHLVNRCSAEARDYGPDLDLYCGHSYEEFSYGPPPEEIAALAFVTADEMQAREVR